MAGFRLVSLVAAPVSFLLLSAGLVPTAVGLGAGRGLGIHSLAINGVGLYVALALWGTIFGAVIGLIASLIRWVRGKSEAGSWWAIANRPIRLFPSLRVRHVPAEAIPTRIANTSRWFRFRLWLWLFSVPALVILAAAFVAGIYAGRFVDRRLAGAIAATDRENPHWRLDDLMAAREPIPDDENSALVVAEAVTMMPPTWPGPPPALPGRPGPPPTEAMLAFERLEEAECNVRLDDETAATLREELQTYGDSVALARTVADYQNGRHELSLTPALLDTSLRETQEARGVARLLAADAAMRVHDGDFDGALDSCRAILGVARSIGDEPFMISRLVRVAIGSVAMNATRRVLGRGEPADAALASLQDLVLDEMAQPLWLRGIEGERAILDEIIRRIREAEIPIESLSGNSIYEGPFPPVSPWGKLLFDHQRAVGLEWMNSLAAIARQPAFKRPPLRKAWEAELERVRATWYGKLVATLPLLMMPAVAVVDGAQSRYQSELGATAILLAAERHRRRTGNWPASSNAIDPAILPHPPLDPFSGQPFRIERHDGEFLVYSPGPNMKDEHGAFEPRMWMKGGPDDVGTGGWDVSLRRRPPQE